MSFLMLDRARMTSASTGLGSMTGLVAVSGYQALPTSIFGTPLPYAIVCNDTAQWEIGYGQYSAGTLSRLGAFSSSNNDDPVDFGAGTKDVFCTIPAALSMTTKGGTFTQPVQVPAGATGPQVPQAQEVGNLALQLRPDIYRRGNTRGVLAMAAGVPTGALMDSEGDADAGFACFACGTQLCWIRTEFPASLTTALGSLYTAGPYSETFPRAFTDTPAVSVTAIDSTGAPCWAGCGTPSPTGVTAIHLFAPVSGAAARYQILAIGRWAA